MGLGLGIEFGIRIVYHLFLRLGVTITTAYAKAKVDMFF